MSVNQHRLYTQYATDWQFYRLSYDGGQEYLSHYLFKHPKELDKYYKKRLERAIYPNHVKSIIDTYAAHLYREPISRSTEGSANAKRVLAQLWENSDMLGTPMDEFVERAAQLVQRDGRLAVVVDRTDPGRPMRSRADEIDSEVRPYVYTVEAENVIDWSVDRLGRFNWVVIREMADQIRTWSTTPEAPKYQYRVWYRERWELYVDEGQSSILDSNGQSRSGLRLIDQGLHPVGEVPVAWVYWGARKGAQPVADSAIKDLAPMNRRATNLYSLIDEQIYQYVFSILVAPQATYDVLKSVNWSVSGVVPYPDTLSGQPLYYLSPDVEQLTSIQEQIDKTEDQMRILAGMGRTNQEGKSAKSGLALSYLTMDKDALLANFSQRMSRLEDTIDRFALAWMDEKSTISRVYPTTFDPADVKSELEQAILAVSLGAQGEYLAEILAQAAKTHLGKSVTPERLAEIVEDIRSRASNRMGDA
jgi:hypothetical protein